MSPAHSHQQFNNTVKIKVVLKKKKKKRFSDTNKYQFYHQIRHLFGTADIKSDDSFQKGWTFILPATREANQSLLLLI